MSENVQRRAKRAAAQQLESLRDAGVTHLAKPRKRAPAGAAVASQPPAPIEMITPTAAKPAPSKSATASTGVGSVEERLAVIRERVARCTRCAELATTRTQAVFGVGNPKAKLFFLGEAPGADEDKQGIPFVGRAGQLLTKIIEACQLKRDDIYIGNVLKCRPPGNRPPEPDEIANCSEYLDEQFATIRPEFVCCLGTTAAQRMLGSTTPIGRLRGKFYDVDGMQVICTYHPSYLLRNPAAKKDVWEDMKMLMRKMGVELS